MENDFSHVRRSVGRVFDGAGGASTVINDLEASEQTRICPNCLCNVTTPEGESHCMSDAEWDAHIDGLIEADKKLIGPKRDALHDWLS